MSRSMDQKKIRILLAISLLTLVAIFVGGCTWVYQLNGIVISRLSGRRFSPPVEFYSAPERIFKGQKLAPGQIPSSLERLGYKKIDGSGRVVAGQYVVWSADQCRPLLPPEFLDIVQSCYSFRKMHHRFTGPVDAMGELLTIIPIGPEDTVLEVFQGEPLQAMTTLELEPELFAEYYNEKAILRNEVELGETPPLCLNGLLAIEDADFLEHKGVSVFGILRAVLKNVFAGHVTQGGSTITQQLVKNYFLTPERTFSRKVKEIIMSLLLEYHATKDEILETYINEIYMGQNGPFEVRGFGAASKHYFSKPLDELELPECALLAAIVNSPGRYDPFSHPEEALKRRNRVLDRMVELKLLSDSEGSLAKSAKLPDRPQRVLSEPAPFFVDAVRKQLTELRIDSTDGLRVYTTLNLRAQQAAQVAVTKGLKALEEKNKRLKTNAEKGKLLEGALISADPFTGHVEAIVGGRQFKISQFNRAISSKRQVGSLMKPLVYIAALESQDEQGQRYTPLSLIEDEKFTIKYDRTQWSPQNFDHKFHGTIPLFYALKESLNVATSKLSLKIGLENVVEASRRFGITSNLKPLPSLALGAFELTPIEILQVYSTLARLGEMSQLTLLDRVENLGRQTIYQFTVNHEQAAAPEVVSVVVGMMKQTILNGTARSVRLSGFSHPAAGKTGTTSDEKDAWFAGFTPLHVAVVWVGYDDATAHGLTGSSGAVPIWLDYMKQVGAQFPPLDFKWPEGVSVVHLETDFLQSLNVPNDPKNPLEPVDLVFAKGTEPQGQPVQE